MDKKKTTKKTVKKKAVPTPTPPRPLWKRDWKK